jgi:hypothetical protein
MVKFITITTLVVFAWALQSFFIWCFWDDIMVDIFNVKDITYWQAVLLAWIPMLVFKHNMVDKDLVKDIVEGK